MEFGNAATLGFPSNIIYMASIGMDIVRDPGMVTGSRDATYADVVLTAVTVATAGRGAIVSRFGSGARVAVAAESAGVDLALKYKPGWTVAQRAEADLKVQLLTDGQTVVSQSTRSGTSAASRYRTAGNQIPAGNDIDHAIDLQLGGLDTLSNMSPLNSSVNRSLGAQIQWQIKDLPPGTVVNRVAIGER